MRIPVSLVRSLQVGLSGTTIALAVGCSHAPAANKEAATTATTAEPAPSDQATWDGQRAGKSARDDRSQDPQDKVSSQTDNRQVPSNPWFLQQPGQPQDSSTQPASETQQPIVAVQPTPPVVVRRPPPPPQRPNWNMRAACGRG
jgi:hypothetical protein